MEPVDSLEQFELRLTFVVAHLDCKLMEQGSEASGVFCAEFLQSRVLHTGQRHTCYAWYCAYVCVILSTEHMVFLRSLLA